MSEIQNDSSQIVAECTVVTDTTLKSSEIPSEANVPTTQDLSERSEILSKRKQKKILKMAKWQEMKKIKRQKQREKQKERRATEVKLGIIGPSAKRKKLKANKMDESPNLVTVAIDFDYDQLMLDKDIGKCSKQMLRVYTENRKSKMPIQLHFTSIRENSRIKNSLSRNDGYANWDVKIHEKPYFDLFDHSSIVYLTSDSDHVLDELDPKAVYIIGGLVDHGHCKGESLQRAEEKGFKTARLPLSEHIEMKTRSVLTIVHVFEILLRVSEGKPWKKTLLEVLPQRKFNPEGKKRRKKDETGSQGNKDDDDTSSENENKDESMCEEKISENSMSTI
ncbi:tRNA methyltransferase 10 homolog A [Contarinia nasturtii]|uniref:tRNA methyltransferase 10 homolog A n=1 Tax=Contarinia nasturtii TaxID=265458 RepID=UPI0012D493D6|nr:tRNA methyltransferase 10 homolog A [Contarinia nasturtii]